MPVVLATLCAAAYANTFHVPFIFDDFLAILNNPSIRRLWPIWPVLSPPRVLYTGGRPVVNLSFAVNYALGGMTAWGYHLANLIIHLLAALALLGIVRRTLLRPALQARFGARATTLALAVAVLWMVHPLQTEAVTYISERCELLMGLFYLLTLYCFIRGSEGGESNRWFLACVAACFLGTASKEVMVTAPVMVLLYDRTFVTGSFQEAWARHWRLYLGLASSWLLLAHLMVGLHYRSAGYGLGISGWAYALIECRTVARYLWLSVWPHPLVFDYGNFVPAQSVGDVAPYAAILAALAAGTFVKLKGRPGPHGRGRAIGFLGAWFFVVLSPTSSVVPLVGQPMAEHRMYLPLAAVTTLVVFSIAAYVPRRSTFVFLGLTVVLGCLTFQRNEDYRTAATIWTDALAKRPHNSRAENNLALALIDEGRTADAIPHFVAALRLDPDQPIIRNDYAAALVDMGHIDEGIAQLQETLRRSPDYAPARKTLNLISEHRFRVDIERSQATLAAHPDDPAAHIAFAELLADMGRRDDAIAQYQQALRLDPSSASAHYNLANLLAEYDREDDALAHYIAAASLAPNDPRIQINLGNLFLKQAHWDQAIAAYTDALRLDPTAFEAYNNIAIAFADRGDLPDATAHFREAARLRPQLPEIHKELAEILNRQGLHDEAQRESAEAQRLTVSP
jgi:tetratricopeptide (TPR) repeat protein